MSGVLGSSFKASGNMFNPAAPITRGEWIILWACFCVSLYLVGVLWLRHRKDRFLKKFLWSFILLFPVFGWVFYGAFYQTLTSGDVPPSTENSSGDS